MNPSIEFDEGSPSIFNTSCGVEGFDRLIASAAAFDCFFSTLIFPESPAADDVLAPDPPPLVDDEDPDDVDLYPEEDKFPLELDF